MLAPTLIVGLGGVGSDIVGRVCVQTSPEQKKRVKFVSIDTDVNDLRNLQDNIPEMTTIQTSAPYTVGEYLDKNPLARDTWFPTHPVLNPKTPTEGAGQVRAISRLAFDTALKEGRMRPLEKAIEDLYTLNGEAVQQALRVIVVSSLAGGTGSGVILPAAMYIRNFLEKRLKRSACVMRGFLLLPDIFYSGKSPEEINNLGCNGYAAMRELDAFMRRTDAEKDSTMFREMTLLMPDSVTGEYVNYKNSPFNFCFLFGAQNTADQDLRSFEEYKEQAANIVYAQAVSALSGRSNSNEDNTILTLCSGNGHNRFCGAGSSRILYPQKDVVRYLADQWALKGMGEQWLAIDDAYQIYCRRQEQLQERDPSITIQSIDEFYMEMVEKQAESNAFMGQIYTSCTEPERENAGVRVGRWKKYIGRLGQEIDKAGENCMPFQQVLRQVETAAEVLRKSSGEDTEKNRDEYHGQAERLFPEAHSNSIASASAIINNLLLLDGDLTGTSDDRHLEFWLRDRKGNFINPAALRYFLYGLKADLSVTIEKTRNTLKLAKEKELEDLIDDPDTPDMRESIREFEVTRKFLVKVFRDNNQVELLIEIISRYAGNMTTYFEENLRLLVLQQLLRQVNKMVNALHMFFDSLRTCLEKTARERDALEKKYNNGEGHAMYYVCADEVCLRAMAKEMTYAGGSMNGPMSAVIFRAVKQSSLDLGEITSKGFLEIYNTDIMNFWEKAVLDKYGAKLETNVVDALMNEAAYYHPDALTMESKLLYCRDKLEVTAKLAEPFIEKPMGEVRHPIAVCCYSTKLVGKYPDFITRTLSDEGGIAEEGISENEIIFYHALYGIRATDLAQFSPAVDKPTFKRRAGAYFAAYHKRVEGLGPLLSKNTEITPHLDRNWHLAKYMPDLNDDVYVEKIKSVYRAMVWGLVAGLIKFNMAEQLYVPESNDNRDFIVPRRAGDMAGKENPCDKLSELLDALAVNPPQVQRILHSLEVQINNELRDRKRFGETRLARRLKWHNPELFQCDSSTNCLRISEFDDETDASIFDLLYWVKHSTPVDDYSVTNMNLLRDAILELLEYYVSHFVEDSAYYRACSMVMVDQLQQFVDNMLLENTEPSRQLPKNRILDDTVGMVTNALSRRFREDYQIESKELENEILRVEQAVKRIRDGQKKNPFAG